VNIRLLFRRLVSVICLLAPCSAPGATARPNILWLIAEDFGPHLGCYGTRQVNTPNLDHLAASGARFTRFFTTAPVCSASRSAFMTGLYQTSIDAHHHRSHRGDGHTLPAGISVLPEWLHEAGYFTANVANLPAHLGFKGSAKDDWNFRTRSQAWNSKNWSDLKDHQPFYAQVNFKETHRPFRAPQKADPGLVEVPPYYPDHPVIRGDWAAYLDSATELDRKVGLILQQLERDGLADSTIVVFFGDNGQAHVRGKQFCYDSGLHVPLIIRWPAKFADSAPFKPGTVDSRLLEAIDLSPTMLALAGAAKPASMQGRIFLGPQAETPREIAFAARDRCDETVFRFRTARDARYRYIRNFTPDRPFLLSNDYKAKQYPAWSLIQQLGAQGKLTTPAQQLLAAPRMPAEELYDTESDPHETVNLATSREPAHQASLTRLRRALEQWIVATKDSGADDDYSLPATGKKPVAEPAVSEKEPAR
jgi:N-sulfoglucosamine sulfohydrolase